MNVLLSWMREFVPEGFGEFEDNPAGLAEVLTNLGLVVESVTHTGADWDGIVVAKVLDLRPHPEADKIQLVDVDTGGAASPIGEALQICCGAFNMAVGDLVPLATLGTVMPGGLEIARRKLRGQWSNGMICSEIELGVGEDADGIMVLDPSLTVGQALTDALGVETDTVFELDVEGNRPDGLSVVGVARDLAGKLGLRFELPVIELAETEPGAQERGIGGDRRSRAVPAFRGASARRHQHRPVTGVDAAPPGGVRSAPDQCHCRHLELRDARGRSAQSHLRPGHRAGRSDSGSDGVRR